MSDVTEVPQDVKRIAFISCQKLCVCHRRIELLTAAPVCPRLTPLAQDLISAPCITGICWMNLFNLRLFDEGRRNRMESLQMRVLLCFCAWMLIWFHDSSKLNWTELNWNSTTAVSVLLQLSNFSERILIIGQHL